MTFRVRFAPSPTGYLHVGNTRVALVNWLLAQKHGGVFVLRIDDTDLERSKPEYEAGILEDLTWLGLEWGEQYRQSDRRDRYEEVRRSLIAMNRLYPCYETPEELDIKRKMQLSRGLPPIYDRAALKLTGDERAKLEAGGRKPHYRFLLTEGQVQWDDLVRGHTAFAATNMSDPVLFKEDGWPTYILSSVVDDGDFGITHIIRGEDHVSNTGVQIQIFDAVFGRYPQFAHLSLLRTKDGEISKRLGGFDIRTLRSRGMLPMAVCSLLGRLGTSLPMEPVTRLEDLIEGTDFGIFGKAPANYDATELERLNGKLLSVMPYGEAAPRLKALGLPDVGEGFWNAIRANLTGLMQIQEWWDVCHTPARFDLEEPDFTRQAAELLPPEPWTEATWGQWLDQVKQATGRGGKALFMPIRKALTGQAHGPELAPLLPLMGRDRVSKRLQGQPG